MKFMTSAGLLLALVGISQAASVKENRFKVVHLNDFHGRVEGLNKYNAGCKVEDTDCDGGWQRIFSAARQIVAESDVPVIFLENGDQFTGTTWSTFYKGEEAYTFLNRLCDPEEGVGFAACVGGIGNHEWDFGYDTLATYMEAIEYPIAFANINDNCESKRIGNAIKPYHVIDLEGFKVGVIGYLTTETKDVAVPPACIEWLDEDATIKKYSKILKEEEGVDIIIGNGHVGIQRDMELAQNMTNNELDVMVGGHSHTMLWGDLEEEGELSELNKIENPVLTSGGDPTPSKGTYGGLVNGIPIFQAFFAGRYLGAFDVVFDTNGNYQTHTPEIKLIGTANNASLAPEMYQFEDDEWVTAKILEMRKPLDEYTNEVIGANAQDLPVPDNIARREEVALGNAIADAVTNQTNKLSVGDIDLTVINGGGIRTSLEKGVVTLENVLSILPFSNTVAAVRMSAQQIYLMFEHGYSQVEMGSAGEFLQVGGTNPVAVVYDVSIPPSCGKGTDPVILCNTAETDGKVSRVQTVTINGNLLDKEDTNTKYTLATNSYLVAGGDGYAVFAELSDEDRLISNGATLYEDFSTYIAEWGDSGLVAAKEGRITELESSDKKRRRARETHF